MMEERKDDILDLDIEIELDDLILNWEPKDRKDGLKNKAKKLSKVREEEVQEWSILNWSDEVKNLAFDLFVMSNNYEEKHLNELGYSLELMKKFDVNKSDLINRLKNSINFSKVPLFDVDLPATVLDLALKNIDKNMNSCLSKKASELGVRVFANVEKSKFKNCQKAKELILSNLSKIRNNFVLMNFLDFIVTSEEEVKIYKKDNGSCQEVFAGRISNTEKGFEPEIIFLGNFNKNESGLYSLNEITSKAFNKSFKNWKDLKKLS